MAIGVQSDVAINSRLKVAIFNAKISNKELADRVGITATNMSNIVNGSSPRLKTAQMIVRELNKRLEDGDRVSVDYLWPLPKEDETNNV